MRTIRSTILAVFSVAALVVTACSGDSTTGLNSNMGKVVVRLTDAPFLTDSLKSVDIFVVRVDGRVQAATDAEADANVEDGNQGGWKTLASPNGSINVLELQNGKSTQIGETALEAGTYSGFRFIIDPAKSSVTLKNGTKLTGSSNPGITFPSANKSGIKIILSEPVKIVGGSTTTLLIDFDINNSFVQRGNSIEKNGLLFKPTIKATVTDAATVNAMIKFVNATGTPINILQGSNPLTGGSNIAFGASSSCSSVAAATPGLSVVQVGSTTPLTGLTLSLTAGNSYTVIAYPNATGGVQFSTLSNTFTPTSGQTGLRVFNASGGTTGVDVFVTASGAPLGTATVANTLNGSSSSFVSVPAGSQHSVDVHRLDHRVARRRSADAHGGPECNSRNRAAGNRVDNPTCVPRGRLLIPTSEESEP